MVFEKTKYQFCEFKRISREEGIWNAVKNDFKKSWNDVKGVGREVVEKTSSGALYAVAIPLMLSAAVYTGITLAMHSAGIARQKELDGRNVPDEELTSRDKYNDSIRNWGNNLTPKMKSKYNYGFGDFITQDINFRKAGTMIGITLPIVGYTYFILSLSNEPSIADKFTKTAMGIPLCGLGGLVFGGICHEAGLHLDAILGDKKARRIINERKEREDPNKVHSDFNFRASQ